MCRLYGLCMIVGLLRGIVLIIRMLSAVVGKQDVFDCPQKKRYPCSWWIDRSRQNYQDKLSAFTSVKNMTLVPVSEWLAREVRQSFLKDYPIRVIHNGIDLNVFTPKLVKKQDLGIDDKFVILGVASIWSSRKGLLDFIQLRKNYQISI